MKVRSNKWDKISLQSQNKDGKTQIVVSNKKILSRA